ncbi:finger protein [Colletotrichum costaricense]|uniref:Finger protein n=1 Tax=Colletotrichum costaricense TaxID=1209916 RepID=A0AAJ0DZJ9_9PEZI|nr:finger protein [Colletotrichum costaricense]KAK1525938.1 finger protein [Colletotrichum costaricense]
MTFHDEDIDQQLPLSVDDDQLRPGCGMDSTESGPPITSAPVAQFKPSRIVARVIRSLYGIKSVSTEEHLTPAARFNQDLSEWREPISYLLDTVGSSALYVKHEEIRKNVQLCLDAATKITKHVNYINEAGELYSTLFRYGVVLQELHLKVLRNNTCLAPISNPRAGNCLTSNENNEILPVPYRRSQLRPGGGTSGLRLAVE